MTLAKPNGGGIIARGIEWKTDDFYLNHLLRHKDYVRNAVLRKQRSQCGQCKAPLGLRGHKIRLTIKEPDLVPTGALTPEHVEAICQRCAITIPTTQ